jgi:hypothetical protein
MDRNVNPSGERRVHARSWALLGRARVAARLRTGSPLRVLNTSPDGMLVESPARLLPGRQVDLVLQSGTTQEQAPWVVIHSRVGCVRGGADLRYRAGLRRATGTNYSRRPEAEPDRNELPTAVQAARPLSAANSARPALRAGGTRFDDQDRT